MNTDEHRLFIGLRLVGDSPLPVIVTIAISA